MYSVKGKKGVLIIASEFPPGPGGIGHHAYSLAKALQSNGYKVVVMTPADYALPEEVRYFDLVQPFGIIRFSQSGRLTTYIQRVITTVKFLKKEKGYISVILTGKFPLWLGLIIKQFFPYRKTLAILHGTEVNLPNVLLRKLTHKAMATADIIVPVSEFTKSLLPKFLLENQKNILIIKNGIDDVWLENGISERSKIEGYPALLTIGHVSPRKGQHRVIKALPKLITKYPDIHYHIVGLPLNQNYLQILAKNIGVLEYVTFHGRVASHRDLQFYYESADIFMLLSENQSNGDVEGFGIVALEANLNGLPVIGARYCGVEEAVSHGFSGYLVDGDNADNILEGIIYCLEHKTDMYDHCKLWAKQHHWSEIIKQYEKLLV
jgi:phosphatidylinositol alpha-1,6-mannosyltransferase